MRYKSISCPKLFTNLLASGHAGMFRFFEELQTQNSRLLDRHLSPNTSMPLGDSEMATGAFWLISALTSPEQE